MVFSTRVISFLGFVALVGIIITVIGPRQVSLYVLGLLPIVIFLFLQMKVRHAHLLTIMSAKGLWLIIPTGLFCAISLIAAYQLNADRIAGQLRTVRESILGKTIQLGFSLPDPPSGNESLIVSREENRLQAAETFGLASSPEPYAEAGLLSISQRDFSKAITLLTRATDFNQPLSHITNNLGVAHYYNGQNDEAAEEFQRAAAQAEQAETSSTPEAEAIAHSNRGVALRDKGDLAEAKREFDRALEKSKREDVRLMTKLQISDLYRIEGRFPDALTIADDVLASKPSSDQVVTFALKVKGLIFEDMKQFSKALDFYKQAADRYEKSNYVRDLAVIFNNIGNIYINDPTGKNPSAALSYHQKALAINERLGLPVEAALDHANLAYDYYETDQTDRAIEEAIPALDVYRKQGAPLAAQAALLDTIGLIHQAQGKPALARSDFEESLQLARRAGNRGGEAETLEHSAKLLASLGDYKTAKPLALEAEAIYEQLGNEKEASDIRSLSHRWTAHVKQHSG